MIYSDEASRVAERRVAITSEQSSDLTESAVRTADDGAADADNDAIHIFPLSSVPLESKGLARARLVKNAQLVGRVELFSDARSGSGQIAPSDLYRVFTFESEPHPDVELIETLSELPSYDVYSMRIHLRRLGVELEGTANLDLSDTEKAELSVYMRTFLSPLIAAIYGDKDSEGMSLEDLVALFKTPDAERARQNLERLAEDLQVDLLEIPQFIQEYGDAYLSLSYYQKCFDSVRPVLQEVYVALQDIIEAEKVRGSQTSKQTQIRISRVARKLRSTETEIGGVLDMFNSETGDMWQAITAEKFKRMQDRIRGYQTRIGGALCAVCVKMDAWKKTFPHEEAGGVSKRTDFVLSSMETGLETIPSLTAEAAV